MVHHDGGGPGTAYGGVGQRHSGDGLDRQQAAQGQRAQRLPFREGTDQFAGTRSDDQSELSELPDRGIDTALTGIAGEPRGVSPRRRLPPGADAPRLASRRVTTAEPPGP